MALQKFSLRGFQSEFVVSREVEPLDGGFFVRATLYRGKHWRREVNSISTGVGGEGGQRAAENLAWDFRNQLIARHGLRLTGSMLTSEEAARS